LLYCGVLLIWLVVSSKEKAKARVADKVVVKDLCVHILFAVSISLACVAQKGQRKAYR
jgi:hypothetical protein